MGKSTFFLKKGLANISLLAIFWNLFLPVLNVSAEYTQGSNQVVVNNISTATGTSELTAYTWSENNILAYDDMLSFAFDVSSVYSWALIEFDYAENWFASWVTSTGAFLYFGWDDDFSTTYFSWSINGSSTGFSIFIPRLSAWEYDLTIIPWTGSVIDDYRANGYDTEIFYEFQVAPIKDTITPEILSATWVSVINYNDAIYRVDINFSWSTIEEGDFAFFDIENDWLTSTWRLDLLAWQSTWSIDINLWTTFENYTWSGLNIHVAVFNAWKTLYDGPDDWYDYSVLFNQKTIDVVSNISWVFDAWNQSMKISTWITSSYLWINMSGSVLPDWTDYNWVKFNIYLSTGTVDDKVLYTTNSYDLTSEWYITADMWGAMLDILRTEDEIMLSSFDFDIYVGILDKDWNETLSTPFHINFSQDIPRLDYEVYDWNSNVSIFWKEILFWTWAWTHLWNKSLNARLLSTALIYNIDWTWASFSWTENWGCISNWELTYWAYGENALDAIALYNGWTSECQNQKIFVNFDDWESHKILVSWVDSLWRDLDWYEINYKLDKSLLETEIQIIDYIEQTGSVVNTWATSVWECNNEWLWTWIYGCIWEEPIQSFSWMINYNAPELHLDSAVTMVDTADFIDLWNVTWTWVQFITIWTWAYINTDCPTQKLWFSGTWIWLENVSFSWTCNIEFSWTNEVYTISYTDRFTASVSTQDNVSPKLISSTWSNSINYNTNSYRFDIELSWSTIEDWDFVVVEIEWGMWQYIVTWSLDLVAWQSTWSVDVNLWTIFEAYTWSELNLYTYIYNLWKEYKTDYYDDLIDYNIDFNKHYPELSNLTGATINYNDTIASFTFDLNSDYIVDWDHLEYTLSQNNINLTWSVILSNKQSTGTIDIDLWNNFTDYTGSYINLYIIWANKDQNCDSIGALLWLCLSSYYSLKVPFVWKTIDIVSATWSNIITYNDTSYNISVDLSWSDVEEWDYLMVSIEWGDLTSTWKINLSTWQTLWEAEINLWNIFRNYIWTSLKVSIDYFDSLNVNYDNFKYYPEFIKRPYPEVSNLTGSNISYNDITTNFTFNLNWTYIDSWDYIYYKLSTLDNINYITGTVDLISNQATGSLNIDLWNTFYSYTGSYLKLSVIGNHVNNDSNDCDEVSNLLWLCWSNTSLEIPFNKALEKSILLNWLENNRCSLYSGYIPKWWDEFLNLSGSVFPEWIEIWNYGWIEYSSWAYYKIYVDWSLTYTWSETRNECNNVISLGYNNGVFDWLDNWDMFSLQVWLVDAYWVEYKSNELPLIIDWNNPSINTSFIDNADWSFTLTNSWIDNESWVSGFYWFDEEWASWLDDWFLHTRESIWTWNTLTITPTKKIYYATVVDKVWNFTSTWIELPIIVNKPEIIGFANITNSWFTVNWTSTWFVTDFDLFLNWDTSNKINVWTGITSYSFSWLTSWEDYYVWIIANNWDFSSIMEEQKVQILWNGVNFAINLDQKCIETDSEWNEYLSVNLDWNNFYDYKWTELTSTSAVLAFDNLLDWTYNYNIWAWKCWNVKGTITLLWNPVTENINISAWKWINTIVRENTLTWNIVAWYNIELNLASSSSNNYWEYSRYAYVENNTGTLLKLENVDYNVNIRDNQTWSPKTIVWIYKEDWTDIYNNIVSSTDYFTWDLLTIVVKEWNVIDWVTNISTDWYISLYNSWTTNWVAWTSIRNGKFTLIWVPDGEYILKANSYDYKYNNYEENLIISSDVLNKNIVFTTKNLDVAWSFNKAFALEWGLVRLKLDPKENTSAILSIVNATNIVESATYKIYDNSWVVISNWIVDWNTISWLVNNSITVDIRLKSSISTDINFLTVNFKDLELSLPISRINFDSPTTVKNNTDFIVRWNAPINSQIEVVYNGQTIWSGASINWGFEITSNILNEWSGSIFVKDITNNITSEAKQIVVWSSLPILSWYNIYVNDKVRVNNTDNTIKYFSVWANSHLQVKDKVNVSVNFTENQPDSIEYYIWGIKLDNWVLDKYTLEWYGSKDVIVEYTKAWVTYSQVIAKMVILIDPAWYVYNNETNKKIAWLTAELYELQDKDWNRVTSTWGVDMTKILAYKWNINTATWYTKDDIISSITECQWGWSLYPCTWVKYDSTWYWEEPNPQVTDDEWHYAWMTPEGYYYVAFSDTDGDTNEWTYSNFNSLVAHIPPEVTDLNVWVTASHDIETEDSTNYTRTREWNWTVWSDWSYTCKNSYTWDTCQTAPVVYHSGWGWWWGSSYTRIVKEEVKEEIKEEVKVDNDLDKTKLVIVKKYISKNEKVQKVAWKLDKLILKAWKKSSYEVLELENELLIGFDKFIDAYKAWNKLEKIKIKRELILKLKEFKEKLKEKKYIVKNTKITKFSKKLDSLISKKWLTDNVLSKRNSLLELLDRALDKNNKFTKEDKIKLVDKIKKLYKEIINEIK